MCDRNNEQISSKQSPYRLLDGGRFVLKPSVPSSHATEKLEKYLKGVNIKRNCGAASAGSINLLRQRANAQNVSFRMFIRWPIHILNPVTKTKLSKTIFTPSSVSDRILVHCKVISQESLTALVYTPARQMHCQRNSSHPTTQHNDVRQGIKLGLLNLRCNIMIVPQLLAQVPYA